MLIHRLWRIEERNVGFTLIELLVVIAIIGILAAILFPVFGRAKAAANGAAAISRVRQLAQANVLYLSDADDRYPLAAYSVATGFLTWKELVDPYVKNQTVWYCEGSSVALLDGSKTPTTHWGYNASYLTTIRTNFYNANSHTATDSSAISAPSETVLYVAAKASKSKSWCGDDGKYLLAPSQANADCWGRPDPTILEGASLSWCDTHAGRRIISSFYTGQSPVDRYFSLTR